MLGDVRGSISWAGSWGWHRHDTTSQRPFRTVEMVAARDWFGRSGRSGRTRSVDDRRGLMRTTAYSGMKWHGRSKRCEPMPTAAGFTASSLIAAPANTAKNPTHQVSPSPREGRCGHRPPNGSRHMKPLPPTELLSPRQLAARWGLSEKTLERWRMLGTRPAFLKLGSRVLYSLAEIEAHERERTRRCTAGDRPSEVWA